MPRSLSLVLKIILSSLWVVIWKFPLPESYNDYQYTVLFNIINVVVFIFSITFFLFNLFALAKYLTIRYYTGKQGYITKEELVARDRSNSPVSISPPNNLLIILPWSAFGVCCAGVALAILAALIINTPSSALIGFLPLAGVVLVLPAATACTVIYVSKHRSYKKFLHNNGPNSQ